MKKEMWRHDLSGSRGAGCRGAAEQRPNGLTCLWMAQDGDSSTSPAVSDCRHAVSNPGFQPRKHSRAAVRSWRRQNQLASRQAQPHFAGGIPLLRMAMTWSRAC